MLIIKDGISRNIDEGDLQIYRDKGYEPVASEVSGKTSGEKPLDRMNKTELEAKAAELGLQNLEGATKKDIVEMILATQGGGE